MRFASIVFALLVSLVGGLAHAQIYVPEIRVGIAPPPPRQEVMIARPSPRHNWIPGYWAWRGGQHVWLAGHWAIPPQPGMVWEPAHWQQAANGWVFREGHWRWNAAPSATAYYEPEAVAPAPAVDVVTEPPAPIIETRPVAPFGGAVWIPGYWHWNGFHHAWVGGRWSAGRPGFVWEAHRWERGPGGWHMMPGHWRRM
jgi:hypothetical protein